MDKHLISSNGQMQNTAQTCPFPMHIILCEAEFKVPNDKMIIMCNLDME